MAGPRFVDARFAGGAIEVEPSQLPWAPEQQVIRISGPGFEFPLLPHEATALAYELNAAAAKKNAPAPAATGNEGDNQNPREDL